MIRDFKAKPEKWIVALGETPEQGRDTLLETMKAVWHGQHNRHGTPDEARPSNLRHPEAEAALHTAMTLVTCSRRDSSSGTRTEAPTRAWSWPGAVTPIPAVPVRSDA